MWCKNEIPEIKAELFRRIYSLPEVRNVSTRISISGERAIWLREDLPLAHPEVIARGREFAHIHPDGRLHVALPPGCSLQPKEVLSAANIGEK